MISVFLISFSIIFILNFIAFLIAFSKQTDHLTDITYSLSFVIVSVALYFLNPSPNVWQLVLMLMVIIWATRLGIYLLSRIKKMKRDERFDEMRTKALSFLGFWTLQAISVFVISIPFIVFLSLDEIQIHWTLNVGLLVWFFGFAIESLADHQKSQFKKDEKNKSSFIQSGLWKYIQYPNYLGEILCWIGIFIFISGNISGILWASIISPIWIVVLLLFVSGIPLLESSASKKYGEMESFKEYTSKTYRLIPFIW